MKPRKHEEHTLDDVLAGRTVKHASHGRDKTGWPFTRIEFTDGSSFIMFGSSLNDPGPDAGHQTKRGRRSLNTIS
jgi:hypothetical protein